MRPASAIARRALRDSRTRTLSFALLFAFGAGGAGRRLPQRVSDPRRPRRARAHVRRQPGHAPALRHAARPAHDGRLGCRGGSARLRVFAALWALFGGRPGAARGGGGRAPGARARRRRRPRRRVPRPRWRASAPGAAILWLALFAGLLAGRVDAGGVGVPGARHWSRPPPVFAGVGALASQLAPTRRGGARARRRRARRALALRMVADTSAPLDWLRWATPLGWAEELRPFVGARPLVLVLPALAAALLLAASWRIAARRDIGAGLLPARDSAPPRTPGSRRPRRRRCARSAGGLFAWLVGAGLFALLLGALADSVVRRHLGRPRRQFRSSARRCEHAKGFLGLEFLFLVLAVSLFVCFQIAAAREEEAEQRLETLLALPVGRRRWLAGRLAVAAAGGRRHRARRRRARLGGRRRRGRRRVARRAARGGRELPARGAALPRARGPALRARPARERGARLRARRRELPVGHDRRAAALPGWALGLSPVPPCRARARGGVRRAGARRSCSHSPRWRRSPRCACSSAATSSAPDAREKFLRPAPPHGSIGGAMLPSYSNGPSTTPLLGETIGDNLDRMAARFPDREALEHPLPGRAHDVRRARGGGEPRRRALIAGGIERGDRVGHLGAELRGVGARAVRDGEGRRDPRERQPRLPDDGARVRAQPVGLPPAGGRAAVQELGLRGDGGGGARRAAARSSAWSSSTGRTGTSCARPASGATTVSGRAGRPSCSSTTRSTSSTRAGRPASRRAPRSPTTTSSTTATSSAHGCRYTEEDRICIPVPFYHCFGMVMGNLGATSHGACMVVPGARVRARRGARDGAGRALHEPLRRADDVHRRARASRLRLVRPDVAADRDHGRLAVPGRGHAPRHRAHAHGGRDHLLRHDGDVARVHPDGRRRPARAPRRHRRARASAPRGQGRRPGHGEHRRARGDRRVPDPRLLRDARLLGRRGAHGGGDRPRRVDAHGRSGDDGRGGLPQDRRPLQGHGHPRRRERVPARGRGVPLRAPGHHRRPGRRRARPALRRGAVRVRDPARGRGGRRPRSCRSGAAGGSRTTRSRATCRSCRRSR